MEQQKCQCLKCGNVFAWVDYKTGIGKTPEQLEGMRKRARECHTEDCGGPLVTVHPEDRSRELNYSERAQLLALPESERYAALWKLVER